MKQYIYKLNYVAALIALTFCFTGNVMAASNKYAKAVVHAVPTGAGTVYIGNDVNTTEQTSYTNGAGNQDVTFVLHATPNTGYSFIGWYNAENDGTVYSTSSEYTATINTGQTDENNPQTVHYYGRFQALPVFYFSATATATPSEGGTASVSPSGTNVYGATLTSTSATTTAIAFSATPSSSYHFLGWSLTADGAIESTANPYNPTLTSTSKNSGSPTNTTYYARFQPYATSITPSSAEITIYVGQVSPAITYSVSPSGAYDEHTIYESANTSTATVNASGVVTGVAVGTTTITVKSLKDDNSSLAASATVTVHVKNRVATPVININDTGNVTITCATSGTDIYYTTDGRTPTTSSTLYEGSFQVDVDDEVRAIAVKSPADASWDDSDIASQIYSACITDEPEISFEGNSSTGLATVTITAETGVTIYYTTDGTEPTISSSTYTAPLTNIAYGTVVKAIAKSSSCRASEVESKNIVFSYASGGAVVLEDREGHSWSYYNDPECPIRSLNPADVTITYFGDGIMMTGSSDYTASSTDYVQSGEAGYVGGAKVNVGGENENTFIYNKTLERGDATQTQWTFSSGNQTSAASRCPYTTIPNPFQVRPTYGSTWDGTGTDTWTGWRGFQCWRLKSVTGGAVYRDASGGDPLSVGAVINAETEIYFAPNSEYGMEVDLEAVWAIAYVVKANGANANAIQQRNVGYERNFIVLHSTSSSFNFGGNSGKRITNINYSATVSTYYPDGTKGANDGSTLRGANNDNYNLTLQANTKFENIPFNMGSYTLTAAGNNLFVGRGCSGTVSVLTGMNGGSTSAVSYAIRVESGTYKSFYLGSNNGGQFTNTFSSRAVLGCDYDRAKEENSLLSISPSANAGNIYGGTQMRMTSSDNKDNLTFDWIIKSGKYHDGILGSADGGNQSIYLGSSQSTTQANALQYIGKRRITIEGGELASIAGGMNSQNTSGTSGNYDSDYTDATTPDVVTIRMKGGNARGSIYGAAAFAGAKGGRTFVLTGGEVLGWIAGGANGTSTTGGQLYGSTYIYVGGNLKVGNSNGGNHVGGQCNNTTYNTYGINGADGGSVFGAGCGILTTNSSYTPNNDYQNDTYAVGQVNNSTVAIADNTIIYRDVYAGGNYGYVRSGGTGSLYILGGTVKGTVYGGSNNQQGQTVNVTMKGGTIENGLYGGSNSWGTINDDVTMNISGGQVGTSSAPANVHGGGLGQDTRVLGNVTLNIGDDDGAGNYSGDAVIYGDVYGGSAKGKTNGNTSRTSGATTSVTLNGGTIHGSLYGGGLGDNTNAADVYGPVTVVVNGGSVTNDDKSAGVYGCNNVKGAPQSTVTVTVNGTDAAGVDNVFGGGNQADYTPPSDQDDYPTVTMTGGTVNNSVFGGGNQADILGNANVSMSGGTVKNRVFGGGNLGNVGTINGRTTPSGHSHSGTCIQKPNTWSRGGTCTVNISGGTLGDLDYMTMPDDYGYVFGASRGETADPVSDPDIDFKAYVKETFVTVSGTAFILGGVYGGSENGRVRYNTNVKIQGGQIGCGKNQTTPYTESQWTAAINAVASGNAAAINSAAAEMPECSSWEFQSPYEPYDEYGALGAVLRTGTDGHTFYGNVFGGGSGYWPYKKADNSGYEWLESAGEVEGSTKVEITGGHILTSVYGGNELTDVTGDSCVVIMRGGTLGVPRTLSQIAAHPVTCYLFGAGKGDQRTHFNERTNVKNVRVHINGTATIFGSVFGGGEDGHVNGNVKMEIYGGSIGTWGTSYVEGNVFGAGRGFSGDALTAGVVQGNVNIEIKGGTMLGSVYGGGRLGSVGTYLVPANDANYGKLIGSAGDTDHGNITINISGGIIGNSFEYKVPTGNWTQAWKETNHIPNTEFGSTDTDANRLMHTKGGNVFAGSMGRLYHLDGSTLLSGWPDLGKARKTVLNISGGAIKSNVYGGGELGVVAEGTTISITGGTIGTEVSDDSGVTYTFGSVFGGGYGSDANVNGSSIDDGNVSVNARDHAGLVRGSTDIDVSGASTRIWASVYGGGELARVDGNTDISITNGKIGKEILQDNGYVKYGGYRMGNVFGGGKGSLDYAKAGLIKGNANVSISGGNIFHNVYGGGALGSVGTFTTDAGTSTTTCAANTGQTTVTITGGTIGINGHDNGMVNGSSRGGEGRASLPSDPLNEVAWVNNSIVTIGTEGQGTDFSTPLVKGSVYGGGENGHNLGNTKINIYSGTVGTPDGDFDHGNIYGAGCGTDSYTYNNNTYYNPMAGIVHGNATVDIKGGKIERNIYGAGSMGTTEGNATINVTGARIMGSVYGGPKGREDARAENASTLLADVGGNTEVNINYASTPASDDGTTTHLIKGSVFGGGEAGVVKGNVLVNMNSGLVQNDIYGGGALANTNIDNVTSGYGTGSETITSTATKTTTINLHGGTVGECVYGGGLGRKAHGAVAAKPAFVYGDVLVKLNETTASDNCKVLKIHGCNNYNGSPKGAVTVHVYKTVAYNSTYTRSADKHSASGVISDQSYDMEAVYGGGNEAAHEPYTAATRAYVIIDGCDNSSIRYVYGGGNAAPAAGTHVEVNGCYEIFSIFGGGNGFDAMDDGSPNPGANVGYKNPTYSFTPDPDKTDEENEADREAAEAAAFTAQKASLAYGSGEVLVDVFGGTVHNIFGGSNTKGNIRTSAIINLDEAKDAGGDPICDLVLDEVYGAGNRAEQDGTSEIRLNCISYLKEMYGGAREADINNDVVLTIQSGRFDRVFGGNNLGGSIGGTITVNVEETGCHPIIIGQLYGGGNQASYTAPTGEHGPTVNVKSFTSIGEIYGGGYGETAVINGDTYVNINECVGENANAELKPDNEYSLHTGDTITIEGRQVVIPLHKKGEIGAIGTVFGGGNAARVVGNTTVNVGTESTVNITTPEASPLGTKAVVGVDIKGNVFGGGNQAEVTGNTNVNIGQHDESTP